jgi:hypothetical protein
MSDELVTIRKFGSPQNAYLARSVLAGANIPACVLDDGTGNWLWHLGSALGGTKLLVASYDAVRATELLRTLESSVRTSDGTVWTCPHCGSAVDGAFDVCWSCETARDELGLAASPQPLAPSAQRAGESAQHAEEGNSYDEVSPVDADAERAWRATLFGMMFFPPLLLYALYLFAKNLDQNLSSRSALRFYAATTISVVAMSAWWTLLRL